MKNLFLITLLGLGLLTAGCGNDTKDDKAPGAATRPSPDHLTSFSFAADTLVPRAIPAYQLEIKDSLRVIRPDELDSVRAEEADGYLAYNLIGLVTGDYTVQDIPVHLELMQFASPEDAFGYVSVRRPTGTPAMNMGEAAYRVDSVLFAHTGSYLLRVSTADDSDTSIEAAATLAKELISRITDDDRVPPFHILFPRRYQLDFSKRYYAYDYLGMQGIEDVYTTEYAVGGDTMELFLTVDSTGEKFLALQEYAEAVGAEEYEVTRYFDFDHGYAFSFDHPGRGRILAGLARQKLVGVAGYNPRTQEELVANWITGLQK